MMDYVYYRIAKEEVAARRRQAELGRRSRRLRGQKRPTSLGRLSAAAVAAAGGLLVEVGCRLQMRAEKLAGRWGPVGPEVPATAASSQPPSTGC